MKKKDIKIEVEYNELHKEFDCLLEKMQEFFKYVV